MKLIPGNFVFEFPPVTKLNGSHHPRLFYVFHPNLREPLESSFYYVPSKILLRWKILVFGISRRRFLQFLLYSFPGLYDFASLYLFGRLRLYGGGFCCFGLLSEGIMPDFPSVTFNIAESNFAPKRFVLSYGILHQLVLEVASALEEDLIVSTKLLQQNLLRN